MIMELCSANRIKLSDVKAAPSPLTGSALSKMDFQRDEDQRHIQILKRKRHVASFGSSRNSNVLKETFDEYSMSCSSHDDSEERDEPDHLSATSLGFSDSIYQHHLVTPTTTGDGHIYEDDDDFAEEMALVKRFRNSRGRDSRPGEECELASSPFHLNDYDEELEAESHLKSVNFSEQVENDDDRGEDSNDFKSGPFLSLSPRSLSHHPAILRATTFCEDSSDEGSSCGEHHEYFSSSRYQGLFSDPPECTSRSPSPPTLRRETRQAESTAPQLPQRPNWPAPMPSTSYSWTLPHPKNKITPLFSSNVSSHPSSSHSRNQGHEPFLFGNVSTFTKFNIGSS
ncbi:hypothetical protein ACHAXS_002740 [Conticribra weissflogii]